MKIKNLLLTTTALVSAVCMQSALAHKSEPKQVLPRVIHAQTPMHLHIDGLFDVQAGFRSQPRRNLLASSTGDRVGVSKFNRDVAFDAAGALTVEGKGKTEKGLEYGARVSALTTALSVQNNRFFRNHQAVLYMNDMDMGRLELGNDFGAFEAMLPTADRVAAATGGIAGDWYKYVQTSSPSSNDAALPGNQVSTSVPGTVTTSGDFYAGPGSFLDNGTLVAADIQKAIKATYYTPKLKDTGLRFGISYIPDTDHSAPLSVVRYGNANNRLLPVRQSVQDFDKGFQNGIQAAIEWKHKLNKDNKCKIAIVGERADLPRQISSRYNRVGTIGVGASHMYKDFSVAASYVHLGRSGLVRTTATGDGSRVGRNNYIATLGFGYMFDNKTKVSVTGLMSEKARNRFHNISFGAEYKLAQGLMPYAELTYFEMSQRYRNVDRIAVNNGTPTPTTATFTRENGKNRGAAFIIGTRVQF
jgi:hypothetical protein